MKANLVGHGDLSHWKMEEIINNEEREKFLGQIRVYHDSYTRKYSDSEKPHGRLLHQREFIELLEKIRKTNDINTRDKDGNSLLSRMTGTYETDFVAFLLSHPQIDPNTQNSMKMTPLMRVLTKGRDMEAMVKLLLAHPKIDLEVRNNGKTALMLAKKYHKQWYGDYARVIKLIEDKENEVTTPSWVVTRTELAVNKLHDNKVLWSESLNDNEKLKNRLLQLQDSLSNAFELYKRQYGDSGFDSIDGMLELIGYGLTDGMDSNLVDIQAIFTGLQWVENLSSEDIVIFRELLLDFMDKDPKIQSQMLWFFSLINSHMVPKNKKINERLQSMNPLKEVLFANNNKPYTQSIQAIFEGFAKDESWMLSLNESILQAQPDPDKLKLAITPILLKAYIKEIFLKNPNKLDPYDSGWLSEFYKKNPEDIVPSSSTKNAALDPEVVRRNEIAYKYVQRFESGHASKEQLALAESFRKSYLT